MAAALDLDALQAAIDSLKQQREEIDRDRAEVAKLKEVVELNLERFKHVVKLNVGGAKFETTLSTLQRYPSSMLGTMFSGRDGIDVPVDDDGYVFIDRDGTHFRTILNFLRTGRVRMPVNKAARDELMDEAGFYLLKDQMAHACGLTLDVEQEDIPKIKVIKSTFELYEDFGVHEQKINEAIRAVPRLRIISTNTTSSRSGSCAIVTTLATHHTPNLHSSSDDSAGCTIM